MIVQCYMCGFATRRKTKPNNYKCPLCKSGSFQWHNEAFGYAPSPTTKAERKQIQERLKTL